MRRCYRQQSCISNGIVSFHNVSKVWHDLVYSSPEIFEGRGDDRGIRETLMALTDEGVEKIEGGWSREDEILDDNWIERNRKKGKEQGSKSKTSHLEGLNWEVVVVNEPMANAFFLPGGKIVVFIGLLEHFKMDGEITTVVGHEVGHAVARHVAEQITKNLWFNIIQLILHQFIMPDIANVMSTLLLRLPFSGKMEMEADYVGLLLMASAGFNPRVAPKVYEKLGKLTGDSLLRDYLSTHPSGKKRAQSLASAGVMEEALALYRDARAGPGVEGFL